MSRLLPILALLALAAAPRAAGAQEIAVRRLSAREVPAGVERRGTIEAARRWRDRSGDNLLVLTRTAETQGPPNEYAEPSRQREIYVYHYVRDGAGYRLLWRTVDHVRGCDFDLTLSFVPGSLQVTDVDRDGLAETSYAYRLACRSDVSPAALKLILHEGATKYAVRGTGDMRQIAPGYPAPEMRMDPALTREPALRALAERQWRRVVREGAGPEEGAP
ncbi:MAG TPA: hypothetical protein VHG91_01250 [Longimicrobium sp.]|nr:hypothetical protein [Longimicrobium sp.]